MLIGSIQQPLCDIPSSQLRLNAVKSLLADQRMLHNIKVLLSHIADGEKIAGSLARTNRTNVRMMQKTIKDLVL